MQPRKFPSKSLITGSGSPRGVPEGVHPATEYSTVTNLPRAASFWGVPLTINTDLAEATRKQACPCGGRLHEANYPASPAARPSNSPSRCGSD